MLFIKFISEEFKTYFSQWFGQQPCTWLQSGVIRDWKFIWANFDWNQICLTQSLTLNTPKQWKLKYIAMITPFVLQQKAHGICDMKILYTNRRIPHYKDNKVSNYLILTMGILVGGESWQCNTNNDEVVSMTIVLFSCTTLLVITSCFIWLSIYHIDDSLVCPCIPLAFTTT